MKVRATVIALVLSFLLVSFMLSGAPAEAAAAEKTLTISQENAKVLDNLESYPDLEVLSISCLETLTALPDSIGKLTKLRELTIDNGNGCTMNPVLPESIGNLHALEKLVLYGAQDPREPAAGASPQVGQRHAFPRSMSQLTNLTYLDLGRNGLAEIPEFVKDLPKLKEFGFAWNEKIKPLPTFLTNLTELTTLHLDSDGLIDLPDFLNSLPKLTHVTLGDNCRITKSPLKKKALQKRFPKIKFDFANEYDC